MRKLASLVLILLFLTGCRGESSGTNLTEIEETGVIEEGDPRDADYGGYLHDSFEFHAEPLDMVSVEVAAEGFQPIVTLHEKSTGAHLAEWDQEYSQAPSLSYRIAGEGAYEVRVHAPEGTGPYTLKITVRSN